MRAKVILLLFSILLSSCGLFRSRHKQVLDVRKSAQVERVEEKEEEVKEEEKTTTYTVEKTTGKGEYTATIEADEINVNPNGSINAKGNVKADLKGSGESVKDKEGVSITDKTKDVRTTTVAKEKEKTNEKLKDLDDKSEPVKVNWYAVVVFAGAVLGVWLLIVKKRK